MSDLNVAVIGAGLISREQHLPAWADLPEARVVALADVAQRALDQAGEEFQVRRRVANYRELLDDPKIDVVDICVPSALHAEVAIAALEAGKHVLCEKPMATSRAAAAEILDAWRASGKKLMVGQNMRFTPSAVALKQGIDDYGLGRVYYARGQWLRRRRLPCKAAFTQKQLSGGGALYDLGVHMLDLGWWLMGCPRVARASGAAFDHLARRAGMGSEWGEWDPRTIDVEDFAVGQIRFADGGVFTLEASWLGFQPQKEMRRLQLFGDRAGAIWPDARLFGETDQHPWDVQLPIPQEREKPHRAMLRHFARAVLDNANVPVPPEQSANVIAMLEAIYRSAQQGKDVAVEGFALSGDRKQQEPPSAEE